jgi:hypothetical protein
VLKQERAGMFDISPGSTNRSGKGKKAYEVKYLSRNMSSVEGSSERKSALKQRNSNEKKRAHSRSLSMQASKKNLFVEGKQKKRSESTIEESQQLTRANSFRNNSESKQVRFKERKQTRSKRSSKAGSASKSARSNRSSKSSKRKRSSKKETKDSLPQTASFNESFKTPLEQTVRTQKDLYLLALNKDMRKVESHRDEKQSNHTPTDSRRRSEPKVAKAVPHDPLKSALD